MQINNLVYMYSLPQITFCFARIIYVITYSHWMVITSYMPLITFATSKRVTVLTCKCSTQVHRITLKNYFLNANVTDKQHCGLHGFSKGPRGEQIFLLYTATTLWRSPLTTTPIHAAPWSLKIVPFTLTLYPRAFAGGFRINGAGVTWAS